MEALYQQFIAQKDPDVHYSLDILGSEFDAWEKNYRLMTFQQMLLECIAQRGISNQEFYKAAHIDRKLFSAIKNNTEYQPQKETAVACCLGLQMDLKSAEKLLKRAGFSLSLAINWDRIIYYCLQKGITDIDAVNDLLYASDEKCIRT